MFEDLEKLIYMIREEYSFINLKWEVYNRDEISLKKKLVKDIVNDNTIKSKIFEYRNFINDNIIDFTIKVQKEVFGECRINTRVKAQNSIEYKTKNYYENHEKGKIPINKCFNDLFGIRIILNQNIKHEEIRKFIRYKFKDIKCVDSSKKLGNYKATHIYFSKDNYSFPWELQIWNKIDEENNLESHKKYKQDYVRWEAENKGGDIDG